MRGDGSINAFRYVFARRLAHSARWTACSENLPKNTRHLKTESRCLCCTHTRQQIESENSAVASGQRVTGNSQTLGNDPAPPVISRKTLTLCSSWRLHRTQSLSKYIFTYFFKLFQCSNRKKKKKHTCNGKSKMYMGGFVQNEVEAR